MPFTLVFPEVLPGSRNLGTRSPAPLLPSNPIRPRFKELFLFTLIKYIKFPLMSRFLIWISHEMKKVGLPEGTGYQGFVDKGEKINVSFFTCFLNEECLYFL